MTKVFIVRKTVILILFTLVYLSANCQNSKKEFVSSMAIINNYYDSQNKMEMDVEYTTAERYSQKVIELTLGKNIKSGNNYYRISGNTEIISNEYYHLIIENDAKKMYLLPNEGGQNEQQGITPESINEFVKTCSTIKKISSVNNITEYELILEGQTYDKMLVELDMNNKFIKKIALYDNPDLIKAEIDTHIATIIYSNFSTEPSLAEIDFTLGKYLIQTGNTAKLTKEYSAYEFYDLRR